MIEFAIALLPVAAASGWFVASRQYKNKQKHPNVSHDQYFKGLNYLLNEQPDKAINVFVDLLEVDDETVEVHLALGALFRQRGEVEKSIRLHQNLIARPQINQQLKFEVLKELGLDYMKAGLLDRAESIFLELEKEPTHRVNATKQLLDIFQQEKEWGQAFEYAKKLDGFDHAKNPVLLAHLCCEWAEDCEKKQDSKQAATLLKQAQRFDANCVRVNIIRARNSLSERDCKSALKSWENAYQQDPRFAAIYVKEIVECYDGINKPKQKINFLKQLLNKVSSVTVFQQLYLSIKNTNGDEAAAVFLKQTVEETPSLSSLRLMVTELGDRLEIDRSVLKAIESFDQEKTTYQCLNCGFDAVNVFWNCPSCKKWNTVEPHFPK